METEHKVVMDWSIDPVIVVVPIVYINSSLALSHILVQEDLGYHEIQKT